MEKLNITSISLVRTKDGNIFKKYLCNLIQIASSENGHIH